MPFVLHQKSSSREFPTIFLIFWSSNFLSAIRSQWRSKNIWYRSDYIGHRSRIRLPCPKDIIPGLSLGRSKPDYSRRFTFRAHYVEADSCCPQTFETLFVTCISSSAE